MGNLLWIAYKFSENKLITANYFKIEKTHKEDGKMVKEEKAVKLQGRDVIFAVDFIINLV